MAVANTGPTMSVMVGITRNVYRRLQLRGPDEDVVLHHAQQSDDDGEDPVRGGGEARLHEHDEADVAGGAGDVVEVEQDQQLLHVLLGLNAEDEILLLDGARSVDARNVARWLQELPSALLYCNLSG